jgi:uncharacterized protein YbbC (DUF1343 family)
MPTNTLYRPSADLRLGIAPTEFEDSVGRGMNVDSSADRATGLPIFSLYGATTRPTATTLLGVDVLVYDIQDVGARV